MSEPEMPICRPGGSGTFFPLLEAEQTWSDKVRAVIYAALLIYVFLGVSIVADLFMESITAITSEKRRVRNKKTGNVVTVKRWNATVSNLTLMALGSSAPEILLSIMEMMNNDFYSGELGPSTIVGSAAFNLFCIIGVCIVSIPSPQTRSIKAYTVFVITAIFSIFAYLWLVFIVQVISPDVVEAWEGFTTLAFFPILILISYMADIGWLDRPDPKAIWGLADVEAPSLRDERCIVESKPICDLRGKVIRNAPGVLSFSEEAFAFTPKPRELTPVTVEVLRCNGSRGLVTCKFQTERLTAVPGYDYVETDGTLYFQEGERSKKISVDVMPQKSWKRSDEFQIILSDATGGVLFNPNDDGGEETCMATVTINHQEDGPQIFSTQSDRMLHGIDYWCNIDSCSRTIADWREQIKDALCTISSDDDDEDDDESISSNKAKKWSGLNMAMHIVSLPWKFLFAVVIPPVELCGGWACFIVSLACIGAVTSLIIDLAELFGCVVGIQDSVVAITFVALGTSMPDLFASWKEALEAPEADASIVNVTGSNSVNVFLGIGIPWTMAAVYWSLVDPTPKWRAMYPNFLSEYPNGAFIVMGGNLSFSVVVFTLSATIACLVLWVRRKYVGGELGGPAGTKVLSGFLFCMLWLFYVGLSIWKTQRDDASLGQQVLALLISFFALQSAVLFVGGGLSIYCTHLSGKSVEAGESGGSAGSWVALQTVLERRGMCKDDYSAILDRVKEPVHLRQAALDPEEFMRKLQLVSAHSAVNDGVDTLNPAAMALEVALLRPKIEADVYKLHGLSWEDFEPVLMRVNYSEHLREAANDPQRLLEDLEDGMYEEAAKAFFTAKILAATRPLLSRLGKGDVSEDLLRVVCDQETRQLFERENHVQARKRFQEELKKAIADPEAWWAQSSQGLFNYPEGGRLVTTIMALSQRRSWLEPAFTDKGLAWPHIIDTFRQASECEKQFEEEFTRDLWDNERIEKVVATTCLWARKFSLDTLQEELHAILSNKGWTPEQAQAVWKQVPLKDLVLAIDEVKSGKSVDSVWGKLIKASHNARRQSFIAQIKDRSEVLPDAWMQILPQLHMLPLGELQKAAQNQVNRDSLLKFLGDGSADDQEPFMDSISDPGNRSRTNSLSSSRAQALESELFKVLQSTHSSNTFRGGSDLYAASQHSRDGSQNRLPPVGRKPSIECEGPQADDQQDQHELYRTSKKTSSYSERTSCQSERTSSTSFHADKDAGAHRERRNSQTFARFQAGDQPEQLEHRTERRSSRSTNHSGSRCMNHSKQSVGMVEDEGEDGAEASSDDIQPREGSRMPLTESGGTDSSDNRRGIEQLQGSLERTWGRCGRGLEQLQGTLEHTWGREAGLPGPTSAADPPRQHSLRNHMMNDGLPGPTSEVDECSPRDELPTDMQREDQQGGTHSRKPGVPAVSDLGRMRRLPQTAPSMRSQRDHLPESTQGVGRSEGISGSEAESFLTDGPTPRHGRRHHQGGGTSGRRSRNLSLHGHIPGDLERTWAG